MEEDCKNRKGNTVQWGLEVEGLGIEKGWSEDSCNHHLHHRYLRHYKVVIEAESSLRGKIAVVEEVVDSYSLMMVVAAAVVMVVAGMEVAVMAMVVVVERRWADMGCHRRSTLCMIFGPWPLL